MSHFAEIDSDNIVQRVIVISQENIDTGNWGNPSSWIQTSYNTHGGKHYDQQRVEDSGVALRYNYAGIGYTYDTTTLVLGIHMTQTGMLLLHRSHTQAGL